jgi:DNA-binding transcriptional MerR regulator
VDDPGRPPDEPCLRIGEVSRLTGVKPYVLRYWEHEFPQVAPTKTRANQRLYRRGDVERILAIKRLLYEERYTIAGARARLSGDDAGAPVERQAAAGPLGDGRGALLERLSRVRATLAEVRAGLED